MMTIFFCGCCQDTFRARKGNGGRMVCAACAAGFEGQRITRQLVTAKRREILKREAAGKP
jgi:hypothetical protein